jgi:formate-dependent nitrite reductase membrane component NrfD
MLQELTTTRHNLGIDPGLHIWGWEIPVYLFLGGLVAGMMIISGYLFLSGKYKADKSAAGFLPLLSAVLLSAGMGALFLDLAHKLYVWRMYLTFEVTSPMSWGAWILMLVYPALILAFLVHPAKWVLDGFPLLKPWAAKVQALPNVARYVGAANLLFGAMLGAYTGVLLSALGARPLWNTSVLWLLFLVSGLSSAAAFVHLVAKNPWEKDVLAKTDNGLLVLELFVIAMMIVGLLTASAAHQEAVRLILTGSFASPFWVFVVGFGLVLPFVIGVLQTQHKIAHTPIGPLLVIAGGLALRFLMVYAGQASHYLNAHFL